MSKSQKEAPKVVSQAETDLAANAAPPHRVVSRHEWTEARRALLAKEKEFTKLRDHLSAEQRALPWVRVEKDYVFDGPSGKVTLAELFDGRSQLFIKHFMMAPGVTHQCVGCSLEVDHIEGILVHLENHDVTYVAVARAPIKEIEAVRKRMGWRFRWVSSYNSDFNYDFNVSFTPEEVAAGNAYYSFGQIRPDTWPAGLEDLSGDSVFFKNEFNAAQRGPNDVPLFLAAGDGSPFAKLVPKNAEGLRANGFSHGETGLIRGSVHYVVEEQPEAVADVVERYASPHSK